MIVTLRHIEAYRFEIDFGLAETLESDLSPPLGHDVGPNPEHLLLAATANCLSVSLLFTLAKMKIPATGLSARAEATITRHSGGRLRVESIAVRLVLQTTADEADVKRADEIFRQYCTVSSSLEAGIPVHSEVVVEH